MRIWAHGVVALLAHAVAAAEDKEMGGASSTSLHPDLVGASPSLVPFSSTDLGQRTRLRPPTATMDGGEGKSRKRRSFPSLGEEEGREWKRRDKKESRRICRDDREDDDDRHKRRKKGKHSDRGKGKVFPFEAVHAYKSMAKRMMVEQGHRPEHASNHAMKCSRFQESHRDTVQGNALKRLRITGNFVKSCI